MGELGSHSIRSMFYSWCPGETYPGRCDGKTTLPMMSVKGTIPSLSISSFLPLPLLPLFPVLPSPSFSSFSSTCSSLSSLLLPLFYLSSSSSSSSTNPVKGTEVKGTHWRFSQCFCLFVCLFVCFETGFLCVALAVLELTLVDQNSHRELTEIHLPLPPECWD